MLSRFISRIRLLLDGGATPPRPIGDFRNGQVKRLLVTGAAGEISTLLRPTLRAEYDLLLTDLTEISDLQEGESFQKADLADESQLLALMKDCQGILHLGGQSKEAEYEGLSDANLKGISNLYEAARKSDISRIILASSMHVMGFHGRREILSEEGPVGPDSLYAASKLFGEAVAHLYACKYGIRSCCIRIGAVGPDPHEVEPGNWLAPADLMQLIQIGLTHPDMGYEIFHGLSNSKGAPFTGDRAAKFGYRPTLGPESYKWALKRAADYWPDLPNARRFRGSVFASDKIDEE